MPDNPPQSAVAVFPGEVELSREADDQITSSNLPLSAPFPFKLCSHRPVQETQSQNPEVDPGKGRQEIAPKLLTAYFSEI